MLFLVRQSKYELHVLLSSRDRFRTAVNVWGDSIGAGILNHIFRDLFKEPAGEALTDEVDSEGSHSSIKKEKLDFAVDGTGNGGLTNPVFENDANSMATKL